MGLNCACVSSNRLYRRRQSYMQWLQAWSARFARSTSTFTAVTRSGMQNSRQIGLPDLTSHTRNCAFRMQIRSMAPSKTCTMGSEASNKANLMLEAGIDDENVSDTFWLLHYQRHCRVP
jgi:hypothetical protein